jgi:DNA-3-methyladenine glycosylase II
MVTAASFESPWHTQGENIYFQVPKEFDFSHCLRFLNRSPFECLHSVQDQRWRKLLKLSDRTILIEVAMSSGNLKVHPLNTQLTLSEQTTVISYVWEVFDLARDLQPFYEHMKQDPVLGLLCQTYYGLRLIGIPELFEALSWSIIGQQINLTFAYKLKQRFVHSMGEKLHFEGQDYFLFPLAGKVANMSPGDFSDWQFSTSKAQYLIGVAKAIYEAKISKANLLKIPDVESLASLLQLKGIGPWSAHYVMMKCLRMTNAYPVGDVGLHNALKASLGHSAKPSIAELDTFGKRWHPWQAYATFYLWHSLIK